MEEDLSHFLEFIQSGKYTRRQLIKLKEALDSTYKKKYKDKIRIYRGVNRTFKNSEINLLFSAVESCKYRALFSLLAYCGLRIGEAVQLKRTDLHLDNQVIRVKTGKQKFNIIDFQPIPSTIIPVLKIYTQKYDRRIKERDGWLFPVKKKAKRPITPKNARDVYYYYRDFCGLNRMYAIANDDNNPLKKKFGERKLYELTLHSFRHWFKYRLDRSNIPYGMIRALMRHQGGSVTDQYGHYSIEEKHEAVEKVFG